MLAKTLKEILTKKNLVMNLQYMRFNDGGPPAYVVDLKRGVLSVRALDGDLEAAIERALQLVQKYDDVE